MSSRQQWAFFCSAWHTRWGLLCRAFAQILTVAAGLGWWSTEVLYGEQVVYSYDSQEMAAAQKQISFGSGSR
jgi:hypothetical protein